MKFQRILKKNATAPPVKKKLEICFDPHIQFIEVKGWSITDDGIKDYDKLLSRIDTILLKSNTLVISFKYQMFNSTTIKYLLKIIKLMNLAYLKGKRIKIFWNVTAKKDDEMAEVGFDLSLMCDFDFRIITEDSRINTKTLDDKKVIEHRKFMFGFSRSRDGRAA